MTKSFFLFLVLFALPHFLESEEIADVHSLESMEDQNRFNSLRQRYGDYISYKPPFRSNTLVLWLAPFLLLLGILFMAIMWNIKKRDQKSDLEAEKVIEAIERTRLKGILEEESR